MIELENGAAVRMFDREGWSGNKCDLSDHLFVAESDWVILSIVDIFLCGVLVEKLYHGGHRSRNRNGVEKHGVDNLTSSNSSKNFSQVDVGWEIRYDDST